MGSRRLDVDVAAVAHALTLGPWQQLPLEVTGDGEVTDCRAEEGRVDEIACVGDWKSSWLPGLSDWDMG
eukprot:m.289993 g.289993  ORF g.289993 m.289993 type:complete len:69 (-) comp17802_c1_seq4:8283-8489(-)